MSIIKMMSAIVKAYSLACREQLSKSTSEDIIDAVNFACLKDEDELAVFDDYLDLDPQTFEYLYDLVRAAVINELTNDDSTLGPRVEQSLINAFELKARIKYE